MQAMSEVNPTVLCSTKKSPTLDNNVNTQIVNCDCLFLFYYFLHDQHIKPLKLLLKILNAD